MNFDAIKNNAAYVAQRSAIMATQTVNGVKTIASGTVDGVKGIVSPIAHGALHVTAEAADFVSKSVLVAGPFSSIVLMADAYAFSKGASPFLTHCGDNSPLLFMDKVGRTRYAGGSSKCGPKTSPEQLESLVGGQFLIGLTLLVVATPIVSLAFHKINKLAIRLNNSF